MAQPQQPMWEAIGNAFLKHYYQHFDGDRSKLIPLFVRHTAPPQPRPHTLRYHHHSLSPSSPPLTPSFPSPSLILCVVQKDSSLLTSERETVQGPQAIVAKLERLPRMAHKVTSIQCQPTPTNAILISVTGDLKLEGQTNELKFAEVFQLVADQNNNFYIQNNIFSLNYG